MTTEKRPALPVEQHAREKRPKIETAAVEEGELGVNELVADVGADGSNVGVADSNSKENDGDTDDSNDDSCTDIESFVQARDHLKDLLQCTNTQDVDDFYSSDGSDGLFVARVQIINHASGKNFSAKQVKGNHRSGCGACGEVPRYGYYAVDETNGFYYMPKLCEQCVEHRSNLLLALDNRSFLKLHRMRRDLEEARVIFFDPFCTGGLFECGLDGPFRHTSFGGEPRTLQEHLAKAQGNKKDQESS